MPLDWHSELFFLQRSLFYQLVKMPSELRAELLASQLISTPR
jgi:hypothetical protein